MRSARLHNLHWFTLIQRDLSDRTLLIAMNGELSIKSIHHPYGARRGVPFNSITAKRFTGHAFGSHETSLPGGEGLSFYNARWYDPYQHLPGWAQ